MRGGIIDEEDRLISPFADDLFRHRFVDDEMRSSGGADDNVGTIDMIC